MLGYDSGDVTDQDSSMKMWLDDVECTMNNTDIKDCKHREWGGNDCSSSEAVGVSCYSFVEGATAARLKPVGNNGETGEGILELYSRNQWGNVCSTHFGVEESAVACRMMGFNSGGIVTGYSTGSNTLLEDVQCKGTELDINNCTHSKWHSSSCTNSVRLKCLAAVDIENGVRLVSSVKGAGRVEVYYNNAWGTVCRNSFTYREARVVCRMARLPWSGAYVDRLSSPGQGVIWLSNVKCDGGETTLERCNSSSLGEKTSCLHSRDVSVTCMEARLSNGGSETQGRLEVFYNNQWGTVCEDGFNNMSAKVACEMLGHPGKHAHFVPSSRFGQGSGRVWLTNVQCRGTERSIGDCPHSGWQGTACSHSKDVGVVCSYPPTVHLEEVNNQIILGMSLTVKCVVDDAYPPVTAITWSHNGQTTTGSTFHIRNISKTDRGPLTCSAVNGVGMSPGRATLDIKVIYPPKVHLEGVNNQIILGMSLTVKCVVDDAYPPVTAITWSHNGQTTTGSTFHIRNISKTDSRPLTCSAVNGVGMSPGRATLDIKVRYPPKVHLEGVNNPMILGMSLTVECVVDDAYPPVTAITWSHNGQTTSGSTFHIGNVLKTDRGPLTCSAVNGVGMTPGEATVDLKVVYLPDIRLEPRDDRINVNVGDNLTITCVVDDAEPSVNTFKWILKDRTVLGEIFQLNHVSLSDEGRLTCVAENKVGVALADTFISVSGNETATETKQMTSQSVLLLSAVGGVTGTALVCLIVTIIVLCRKIRTVQTPKQRNVPAASNPTYSAGEATYEEFVVGAHRNEENPYSNLQGRAKYSESNENVYVNSGAML